MLLSGLGLGAGVGAGIVWLDRWQFAIAVIVVAGGFLLWGYCVMHRPGELWTPPRGHVVFEGRSGRARRAEGRELVWRRREIEAGL